MDSLKIPILIVEGGIIRYTNKTWNNIFGKIYGDVIGKTPDEILPPDIGSDTFSDPSVGGISDFYGFKFYRNENGQKIAYSICPMGDPPSDYYMVQMLDVKQWALFDDGYKTAREQIKIITEQDLLGIAIFTEGGFAYINPKFAELFGYSVEEVMSWSPREIFMRIDEEDREFVIRQSRLKLGRKEGYVQNYRFKGIRKDGSRIYLELYSRPIEYMGKPSVFIILFDITARIHAEKALAINEARYRMVVENIRDGIVLLDSDLRIEYANPRFYEIFGLEADTVKGVYFFGLFNSEDLKKIEKEIIKIVERERTTVNKKDYIEIENNPDDVGIKCDGSHECLIKRKEGDLWCLININFVRNPDGNIGNILIVITDITERKRYEQQQKKIQEELIKIQKLESLGVLAGGIAHDFNNILTAVLGHISLAKLESKHLPSLESLLTRAEHAAIRAKRLANRLLTFAKGGHPIKRPIDLRDIIEETVELVVGDRNIDLEMHIPPGLWIVNADPDQIGQVLGNVLLNAIQAMPSGGTLTIIASNRVVDENFEYPLNPGKYVEIIIRDTGVGIPPDILPKVFDPFFTTKSDGTGLGLTGAYSIIRKHGGYITLESEPDKGTKVYIYLPAGEEGTGKGVTFINEQKIVKKRTDENGSSERNGRIYSGKVLLLDDNIHILFMNGKILQRLGFEVTSVSNAAKALELFKKAIDDGAPYDLVILDMTLSGETSGEKVLRLMKEFDKNVKAILMSDYRLDGVFDKYSEFGFDAALRKPFTLEELKTALDRALGNTRSGTIH